MAKQKTAKTDCGRGEHDIWKCKQDLRGDRGRLKNGRLQLHGGHGVRVPVGGCERGLGVGAETSVRGYVMETVGVGWNNCG